MLLDDKIYGKEEVNEPVLMELINSKAVQRLKGVSQRGYPESTKMSAGNPPYYTRYEHSIGCMLLLRRMGAGIDEQIAGLLHDISHTAFSHVADWAIGDPLKEDYQDSILSRYVVESDAAAIITRYGHDLESISNMETEGRFGLLERDAPDICADRIDYALRDSYNLERRNVERAFKGLINHNGELMFDSMGSARAFADCYVADIRENYAAPENLLRYHLLGRALKYAMDSKVISIGDMHTDEKLVMEKIRNSGNATAKEMLDASLGRLRFSVSTGKGVFLRYKLRYVDPKFMNGRHAERLSIADPGYARIIDEEKERHARGVHIEMVR